MLNGTHYRSILQVVTLLGTLVLAGCVSVPDVIKGTTKTPVENLLSVRICLSYTLGMKGDLAARY
ncbi:hypothetical protein [Xenorhabdus sp. BG5]|uniref:hypothetical protein n=1 Tax=Xenorhabdus sp. BG5 TaxID=2782014 RepID=UPI00272CEF7B|nr:hypothetical protein [Xenorhabdus sp. BG5]